MKKLMSLFLFLTILSCSDSDSSSPGRSVDQILKDYTLVEQYMIGYYDDGHTDTTLIQSDVCSNGLITKTTMYSKNGQTILDIDYDFDGGIISKVHSEMTNSEGSYMNIIEQEFAEHDNDKTFFNSIYANTIDYHFKDFQFNRFVIGITSEYYNKDDELTQSGKEELEVNQYGDIELMNQYTMNDHDEYDLSLSRTFTYQYNGNGDILEEKCHSINYSNSSKQNSTLTLQYDDKGRLIERIFVSDNSTVTDVFEYQTIDDKIIVTYNPETNHMEYCFDRKTGLMQYEKFIKDGKPVREILYIYK